jgi:cytochrome c oxidase assembly protein subunit 15
VALAQNRTTIRWLVASAVCVILTLVVGGATRLTESGLSITEWKPVTGVLPPLGDAEWNDAYARYLQIPEAQTVHRGITLPEFQVLFWWEWAHRLSARLAGLVIAIPYFLLLATRRLPRGLEWRLLLLPVLTALQGALGWYMVTSGLSDRTDVSQYRLVAHLGLALVIYVIAVWTAMTLAPNDTPADSRSARRAVTLSWLVFLTLLSGGFVAGLDAGHIYNTFPRMGQGLAPPEYLQLSPAWRNLFENPAAVQFNHRLLAILTLAATAWMWSAARRTVRDARQRLAWHLVAVIAVLQVALGITTLLLLVPIPIAALHQLGAVALLTSTLWAAALARSRPVT